MTLLTLTAENATHVREAASQMSAPEARGAIGAWVAPEAERMARKRKIYRLAFHVEVSRLGLLRFEDMEDEQ